MSTNVTHRTRLARALSEASGISYQTALTTVAESAAAGTLPERLDAPGMRRALAALLLRNPASPFRVQDAARYLGVEPATVAGAVCDFAGVPAPAGPAATQLLHGTLAVLGSVPRGILMVHDLAGTAFWWPEVRRTLPPTPHEAVTLVSALAGLLDPLANDELRDAAAGFALRRSDLRPALRREARRRAPAEPGTGPLPALGEEEDLDLDCSAEREQALANALRDTPPCDWTGTQRAAVFATLLKRLARLGDALLRVTEHAPAPLAWDTGDAGCHVAAVPVPRSPERLEARLRPDPPREPPLPGTRGPLWPAAGPGRPPGPSWRWDVGWSSPPGSEFISQDGTVESTYAAAVFAAEQTVAATLAVAPRVRQRWTGRLLVPRPPGPADADAGDPAATVITWNCFLLAVSDEEPRSVCTQEEFLVSVFDSLAVPWPRPGDPGAGSRPGEPAFDGFLASHAVFLVLPVRAYLDGVTSAATDGRRVQDHHAAGLRRVLDESAARPDGRLAAELGPPPPGMAWTDLYAPGAMTRLRLLDAG